MAKRQLLKHLFEQLPQPQPISMVADALEPVHAMVFFAPGRLPNEQNLTPLSPAASWGMSSFLVISAGSP
ncbi:hypothetical protein [Paenibacillus alvei]|uniref:hypothetical protein n=1 Tax=Paenibacillus alvei TaxID=44250 RepID=UPI0018CC88F5|nr:hypothetical protein [Paenibacillus alvei]MCY9579276.1 hypothetical protein [Paenibacillus alvei]